MSGNKSLQVVAIETRIVKKLKVYNLEVEDDNSYIANGIPVHNCDDLASADYYGFGPGVYTPDATPLTPHAHCLCYLTIEAWPELVEDT